MQIYTEGFSEGNLMIILMIVAYLITGVVAALKMGPKMLDSDSDGAEKGFIFLTYFILWTIFIMPYFIAALGNFVYKGK